MKQRLAPPEQRRVPKARSGPGSSVRGPWRSCSRLYGVPLPDTVKTAASAYSHAPVGPLRLELPIDHFRLLGIGPAVDTQTVLRTLAQRLDRVPDQGFTTETLQVRARLLQDSADLLSDPSRRAAYERELTAVAEGESSVPALEITSSHEVAGLLLLLEAGQAQDAFELVCRSLQPPQAPALGSTREADLCLLAALACQKAAEDACSRRHFETAARLLQQGLQLLQRMGQVPEWRQRLLQDLDRLTPYLVLDLLSRELTVSDKRSEGLALLEQLVQRRGGLEGDGDPGFDGEEFQAFFKQIRGFLTVQEQVDLFSRWGDAGSAASDFLATTALTASGFAQRKPERIAAARERLTASGRSGIEPLLANLHLLLGDVDTALATFAGGASQELKAWAGKQSGDSLGQLCAYCRDWLSRDVLPGYRDLDADADLEAYFSDRDVVSWVEREDRRRGRSFEPSGADAPLPGSADSWEDASRFSPAESLQAFTGSDHPAAEPEEALDDAPLSWALPDLSGLSPARLREKLGSIPLPDRSKATVWISAALALLVLIAAGSWALRQRQSSAGSPRVVALPVQPTAPEPAPAKTTPRPTAAAPASEPPATSEPASLSPLSAPNPSSDQWRQLLQGWLSTKTAVLAGGEIPAQLDQIAREAPIARLRQERSSDAASGQHQTLHVQIEDLTVAEQSSSRIALQATLRYSDETVDSSGKVIRRTAPTQLRNAYVFGRDGGRWRLVASRSLN